MFLKLAAIVLSADGGAHVSPPKHLHFLHAKKNQKKKINSSSENKAMDGGALFRAPPPFSLLMDGCLFSLSQFSSPSLREKRETTCNTIHSGGIKTAAEEGGKK